MPSPIQLITENLAQRKLLSFRPPGLRVERGAFSGNTREIFQTRILDRGGKLLTVAGHMDVYVEPRRDRPTCIQDFTENLAQRKLLSFPLRRDLGSKAQLSQATTCEIFQSRILDRGGKLLTLGGHMICLLYTSDAADERSSVDLGGRRNRNKKTFPAGLRVERGNFS